MIRSALQKLTDSIDAVAVILADDDTAASVGPNFTCREADAIALMLAHGGQTERAARFLAGHSTEDEDDDLHEMAGFGAADRLSAMISYVNDLSDHDL